MIIHFVLFVFYQFLSQKKKGYWIFFLRDSLRVFIQRKKSIENIFVDIPHTHTQVRTYGKKKKKKPFVNINK